MKTKINRVYIGGKWYNLPEVISFEKENCFYEVIDYRKPKKGEFYISGSQPNAYKAPNDLSTEYIIAIPTHGAKLIQVWVRR